MPKLKDLALPEIMPAAAAKAGRRKAMMDDAMNASNMRNYKPRRPEMTLDDVVTPETRMKRAAMMQDAKDQSMQPKIDAAYEASRTTPYKKGGSVSSASSRADGCAERGKTKGTMIMCGGGMARGK
jgi:Mg-chelatase subunit ChlI